jgi:hypothetical protein
MNIYGALYSPRTINGVEGHAIRFFIKLKDAFAFIKENTGVELSDEHLMEAESPDHNIWYTQNVNYYIAVHTVQVKDGMEIPDLYDVAELLKKELQ